ncbi:MAG: DDE-type integrase/transposase/recombinase [Verrucomicrobiales bacterium]|nr:DDE-type integrase/transposase/recombinase [Verrucomicrobiales bacterium]
MPEREDDAKLMRLLDEIYLRDPCLGTRRLVTVLERDHGLGVNRKRLQRLHRVMGMEAIYCKPRTSIPDKAHRIYPYLLRDLSVTRPDQVWCADITYVPMPRGHAYLCAVMDWHTRCVLGWAVSNTMDTLFDSIDSCPVVGPSGVVHSEATVRQFPTRSRSPGVIYFEATRPSAEKKFTHGRRKSAVNSPPCFRIPVSVLRWLS